MRPKVRTTSTACDPKIVRKFDVVANVLGSMMEKTIAIAIQATTRA
jgi:hypothetical protein